MRAPSGPWARDAALAIAMACLMSAVWTLRGWPMLATLHLPDTDDVMRLQQIRDWLNGQRFADLTQHRLGAPPGLPMHWSRLADLVPAAIIVALAPLIGQHQAEIAAVILWPALLLASALILIATIARRIDPHGEPATAVIIAAIAYPATTIFVPGRIDHHGFQIVLLLGVVRALIGGQTFWAGAIAGALTAASIVIGLETAPLLLVTAIWLWLDWVRHPRANDQRLLGYAVSLGLALALAAVVFGGTGWRYPACDGFTSQAWRLAQAGSFAAVFLAIAGRSLGNTGARLVVSAATGAVVVAALFPSLRTCVNPYGAVDPLVARLWLDNVGEAQGLFTANPVIALGYVGLMVMGIGASIWCWLRTHGSGWAAIAAVQTAALAISCLQLRGAYAGAILAAPALAMVIGEARRRGNIWLAAAWIMSAGMLYPLAAQALAPHAPAPQPDGGATGGGAAGERARGAGGCNSPETIARLAALPKGTLMAPIDVGPYAIAGTHHRLVAAPYHRNNAANAALYRFFTARADTARRIAAAWQVDYVLYCPAMLGELGELGGSARRDHNSLIDLLDSGHPPPWLLPVGVQRPGPVIFRIERRLPR